MAAPNIKIYGVDGNYYCHRLWSVLINQKRQRMDHSLCNMFLNSVASDAVALNCIGIVVAFDSNTSWRQKLYPLYKANREQESSSEPSPGSYIELLTEVMAGAGILTIQSEGCEGDDVLASMVTAFPCKIVIGTRDKDILQLVSDERGISIYWPKEKTHLREADVVRLFGVKPSQIVSYLSVIGDKIDNIPGIGCSPGAAKEWLKTHGSFAKAAKADPKVAALLTKGRKVFERNKKLIALKADIKMPFKITDTYVKTYDQVYLKTKGVKIPEALNKLIQAQKHTNMKGLFG